jgi:hypothetical protein
MKLLILVVDDEPNVGALLRAQFRRTSACAGVVSAFVR